MSSESFEKVYSIILEKGIISLSQVNDIVGDHKEEVYEKLKELLRTKKIRKKISCVCTECGTTIGTFGLRDECTGETIEVGLETMCIYCNKEIVISKSSRYLFFLLNSSNEG